MLAGRGAMSARRMEVQLQAGQDTIEQSTSEKLLGGVVQNNGGWKQMIRDGKNSIVFQLNSRLNAMKKLKNADFKTKLSVSTGLIQSKIHYLLPLYGGAPKYLINCIQVKQLQAARWVCGYESFFWSTTKLLKKCGWLSVRQQEFYATSILAHKIVSTGAPRNLYSAMVAPHRRNTRAAANGGIQYGENYKGKTDLTRTSFKYRAQKYYSSIPASIKNTTLQAFKSRLKKHTADTIPVR